MNTEHNISLTIQKSGDIGPLTIETLTLYERIIGVYEGNRLEVKGEDIYSNGVIAKSYPIKMNYYFAMGDNRDNSLDSRFFGFIPEDHIVGKASFIWMSIDKTKSFPNRIRFNRIGKIIE